MKLNESQKNHLRYFHNDLWIFILNNKLLKKILVGGE